VETRRLCRHVLDHGDRAREIAGDRRGAAPQQQHVAISVQRDLVPGGRDRRRCRGEALDLLSHEEERGGRVRVRERFEDRRCPFRMRAVVEGQRDGVGAGEPQRDAEAGGEARQVRRRRGRQPQHTCIVAGMNVSLILGFAAAVGAAVCFDTGYALQALEARGAPAVFALRLSLFRFLLGRPLWVGATGLIVLGWPLQLLALRFAPLTLVQPTLALGLLLLLVLAARVLHERVGRRELLSVAAIVAGVAVIAATSPHRTASHSGASTLVPVLAVLALVAATPYVLRLRGFALVVAAGAGDASASFAAKLVVDELSKHRWLGAAVFGLVAAVTALFGYLSELTALQLQPVTRVGPVVLSLQIGVPVVLARLAGGEHWSNPVLVVASLLVVTAGAALLTSSRTVAGVLEHE
jgi:drug/metabolite transporter (DMT)-like permease